MKRNGRKLALEWLENRTCPTLTLSLRSGGLFISGVPTGATLQISEVAANKFQIMDGSSILGSFTDSGNLYVNLARYNQAVTVDVAAFTMSGNLELNTGLGGTGILPTVTVTSSTGGGSIAGNVSILGGNPDQLVNLGDPSGSSLSFDVGGSVNVTAPALPNNGNTLEVWDGSAIGGDLTATNVAYPTIGPLATGADTIGGNVTLTNALGTAFSAALIGTVGNNLTVSGGTQAGSLFLGLPTGSTTSVGGNLSVQFGSGTNILAIDPSATIEGNLSYVSNSGSDNVTLGGTLAGSGHVAMGDGYSSTSLTGTVFGNLNVVGGNGSDTVMLAGVVSGNTGVQLGNGLDTVTLAGTLGGQVNATLGNGGDSVTYNATGAAYLQVLLGNGNDTLTFGSAAQFGSAYLNGGGGTNVLDTSALPPISVPFTVVNF